MKISLEFTSQEEMRRLLPKISDWMAAAPEGIKTGQPEKETADGNVTPVDLTPMAVPQAMKPAEAPAEPMSAVQTAETRYTIDDLAKAGMALRDQGKMNLIKDILTRFGITALPQLTPDQYGPFATALRAVGAPI